MAYDLNISYVLLDYLESYKKLEKYYHSRGYKKQYKIKGKKFNYIVVSKEIKE